MKGYYKKKGGFTLIEIIIVIVVIAILAAIAIPVYSNIQGEAIEKTLLASTSNLAIYLKAQIQLGNFDSEHIYTYMKNSTGNTDYLSRYLEDNWEILNGSGDSDNANRLGAANQTSGKVGIVNWPANLGDGLYSQQALYITTDSGARYTPGAPQAVSSYYKGSIVIWYNAASASQIYLYYVSPSGMQSSHYYVFEPTDS